MRAPRALPTLVALGLAASSALGCWAVAKRDGDLDRAPVVNTGAGATVIYPGQASPPHPGNYHPREAGYGQHLPQAGSPAPAASGAAAHLPPDAVASGAAQPPPEYGSRSGSGSRAGGGGGGISMLGGAEQEIEKHISINEEPMWLKYAVLPFAVAAAPFKYGYDKIRGEPAPGPAVPRIGTQPRPELERQPQYGDTGTSRAGPPQATTAATAPSNYETARLQGLERELAQRSASTPPRTAAAPHTATAPRTAAAPTAPGSSIADELALLRQRAAGPSGPTPAPQVASAPRAQPQAAPLPRAPRIAPTPDAESGVGQVDRDGDGRTDHWIERRDGAVVSERFDDDFDTRPDRTLVYDPVTREVIRIEEDTDHDGRLDSWTSLRNGQVAGRRVDGDGDGQVDSWSHYRGGTITRMERDADGDGFRDLVAYYRDGRLDREERDDDADGMTDLIRYYDDGERVERVEEDADGDGEIDVISHYEGGRLTRREVLDASVLETP